MGKRLQPISREDFAALPDTELLRVSQFCTTSHRVSAWPVSRSRWFERIAKGFIPLGIQLPGNSHPTAPRYWTKRQVIDAVAQLEAETGVRMPPMQTGAIA